MNDIQKCILSIFKEVSGICEENGITYFAIGGTCIGAVRHKGFIPWDDDLDIAVPIEQFDKLKNILKSSLPEHLKVYECDSIQHYHYIFMKVHDTRTTFIQNTLKKYPDAYLGIFIDIMPISGVPEDPDERARFIRKIKLDRIFNNVRRFPLGDQNSKQGKLASAILKLPLAGFDFNHFSSRYMDLLRRYPFFAAKHVGYVWSPQNIKRWIFPGEWFAETVMLPFEDTEIRCPRHYHEYLTQQFGEYMIPPPPEAQRPRHDGYVDPERPYSEFCGSK